MDSTKSFEELEVWKTGVALSIQIFELFKSCTNFGFRDQIQRSVVSIPSNIAEGFERQTNKEFVQYLFIAKGSCAELRTQLQIAMHTNMINKEIAQKLINETKVLSSQLHNLIQYRRRINTTQ
jgi:four helix bundle protein